MKREFEHVEKELRRLYAALDNVQSGLLVLDDELRAVYSNPALHHLFKSFDPETIRMDHPHYEELLRAAAIASVVDLEDYVATRLAWVRSGDPKPMDLHMRDGEVLRCHLAALPDGGRMLIYSDITDIVRNAEELQRLATTDGMTGIYNRRHFMVLADLEWNRSSRHDRPISLLMIDIDCFKSINDTFGHEIGDGVIIHLAKLAMACKRGSDVLARIGGEEFALLLPETSLTEAQQFAERLRREVSRQSITVAGHAPYVTVSIGVATRWPAASNISDLMKVADKALYEAKRAGRNRVVCGPAAPSVHAA